jgi:hypothetical protein
MKFKLKAWMIFLIGLIIALVISQFIEEPFMAGSLVGEYVFYGGIILVAYYVGYRLWFGKRKTKSDNQ